jgi:exonuclease SbcC
MLNTEASGFNRFTDAIRDIADLAPIAMIYGTPTHDTDGSLEIFRKITCKYGITVLEAGQAYFLAPNGNGIYSEEEANRLYDKHNRMALIFGIPEPRKKYLLADTSMGKDETEETIRDAMHKVCFLLGAKRKDYNSMPCILLYHGDIAGSSLQNDQTIERGTGIAITTDELNDTDADYFALGHIHKPQKVGNLPAYYAGSIFPKNFGETHKAGFNVVELTQAGSYGFNADVERIDFPHPQNVKIEMVLTDNFQKGGYEVPAFYGKDEIKDKKVWLEITCNKEQRAFLDVEAELKNLLVHGAVTGSRVTVCDIPVETVRAAEITEVNTPTKKFEVWAQNSNLEVDPSVLEKIKTLETEVMKGSVRAAGEWELASVKLRGAIGIKKGIGKDEICLNLHNYDSGLIALVGSNGRGKTTLIENCHPYPQLLTRKGKLQDHFCLRDSYREVIYEDRSLKGRGHFVKFLIQIDGQNKSGSCKYFIFDARGFANLECVNEWVPRPGVDGTLKPYEEELGGIFGPVELYLRTAFATQRPTKNLPDLTDATAGEKKTLFVELAGIDYLQKFSEAANEKAKTEAAKNHDAQIKVQMLESAVARKPSEALSLKDAERFLESARKELEKVTAEGKTRKAEVERCQAAWNAEEIRQGKENDARKAVDQVMGEIEALKGGIQRYQEAIRDKTDCEINIAVYETHKKTVDAENEKKQKHLEANMIKQQGYMKEKSAHDEKVNALKVKRDNLCDQRYSIERLVLDAKNNIKLYERDAAEIKENCLTCGQKLPEAKLAELKARREQFVAKIDRENAEIKKHETKLAEIIAQINSVGDEIADLGLDEPVSVSLKSFDETTLQDAIKKMNAINIADSRARLEKAKEANVRIEGLNSQLTDKQKLLDERSRIVRELMAGVDEKTFGRLRKELDDAVQVHAALQENYTKISAEIAGLEANIQGFKRALAEIEKQEKELEALKKEMINSAKEETAWDLISKAFGKDGIQALELDALAPGISDTANKILESAYGDRFRIVIETTRIGGAGKKTKQIEDFVIKVIDSEDGEAVNLEDKSGGEVVWIKRAIYDAFSVIRKRNTNFVFLSCFQDEADGALDSAAKTAYCRMLEAAHAESHLRHTIIITHSNEVKAMIEQRIDMEELAKEVA